MAAIGLEGARATVGGVRPPPRCASARTVLLPSGGGHLDHEGEPRYGEAIVSGIAHRSDEAKVTVSGSPTGPAWPRGSSPPGRRERQRRHDHPERGERAARPADVSFTVPLDELRRRRSRRSRGCEELGFDELTATKIGKVTLVGAGMKSEPGVAAKMFRVLAEQGINLQMISTQHHPDHGRHPGARWSGRCGRCTTPSTWRQRGRPAAAEAAQRADV